MFNPHFLMKRMAQGALFFAAILIVLAGTTQPAVSQSLSTIYTFSGGPDGAFPRAGVIFDAGGNLYGIAGSRYSGAGTVFELSALGDFTMLHNFFGTPDGANPYGAIDFGPGGDLYATTSGGGTFGFGTVFDMTATGAETVLYNFNFPGPPSAPIAGWKAHGAVPTAGVVFDAQGNLFSTTAFGSRYPGVPCNACGGVFELTASGTEKLLHNFTGSPSDGGSPGDLAIDAQGNLYGTTSVGGMSGYGVAFKLTPTGAYTVLHNFAGSPNDAGGSGTRLIFDAQSNMYSVGAGGTFGYGTVFKMTPAGTVTVLYSFSNGTDGGFPTGTLAMDAQGNLYGTTGFGGAFTWGTVFEVTPSGTESVLYNFSGGADGEVPFSGVSFHNGNLYGTTYMGGDNQSCVNRKYKGCGTIFVLTP